MSDNHALGADWFPSPWGLDDQRANTNMLGPAKVLEAMRLVRLGETIPLGFPCTATMPFSPGRSFSLKLQGGPEGTGGPVGGASQTVWNDDFLAAKVGQLGTHMDALGHLVHRRLRPCGHCETLLYNGNKLNDIWTSHGLKRLGIKNAPVFVVHGVLLDVEALKGAPLPRSVPVSAIRHGPV